MTESTFPFHRDPEIMGGALVFFGTREPVRTLLKHLEAGDPVDESLRNFPSVRREQAVATLAVAKDLLLQWVPAGGRGTEVSSTRRSIPKLGSSGRAPAT